MFNSKEIINLHLGDWKQQSPNFLEKKETDNLPKCFFGGGGG